MSKGPAGHVVRRHQRLKAKQGRRSRRSRHGRARSRRGWRVHKKAVLVTGRLLHRPSRKRSGRSTRAKAHKPVSKKTAAKKVRKSRRAGADLGTTNICSSTGVTGIRRWPLFGNDTSLTCAAAAVALSLLLATGAEATRQDVAGLTRAAGGGRKHGAELLAVLMAVADSGLSGRKPRRIAPRLAAERPQPGDVLEITWPGGRHCVCVAPDGSSWLTWGLTAAPFGAVEEAWQIEW